MEAPVLLEASKIVKAFPGVWEHLVLDNIDFDLKSGEVHALLGENGAGKTVLANVLSGFYVATSGVIRVKGKVVKLRSPADALKHGIGMVHQENTLVPSLTVLENVELTIRGRNYFSGVSRRTRAVLEELMERYGLRVDLDRKVESLSVGERQRAEILKVLFWDPEVLILDEPTSALTQLEAEQLMRAITKMKSGRKGIVYITHRIDEVFQIADRVTVLRLGKKTGTYRVREVTREQLLRAMLGEAGPSLQTVSRRSEGVGKPVLEVNDLHVLSDDGRLAVKGVSFTLREGEVLGVAGVAGNGQKELVEALVGLRKALNGRIKLMGVDVTNASPRVLLSLGLRYVPEDRRNVGVVESMEVWENLILKDYRRPEFCSLGILKVGDAMRFADGMVREFQIQVPGVSGSEVRILSGGNVQRLILARELWAKPRVLVAHHPTHGLDLKAASYTHRLLQELKRAGSAILLISEDLDEVVEVSDRVAVMCEGRFTGLLEGEQIQRESVGRLMVGG